MYVGLWSRVAGFERDELTRALEQRAVVQDTFLRGGTRQPLALLVELPPGPPVERLEWLDADSALSTSHPSQRRHERFFEATREPLEREDPSDRSSGRRGSAALAQSGRVRGRRLLLEARASLAGWVQADPLERSWVTSHAQRFRFYSRPDRARSRSATRPRVRGTAVAPARSARRRAARASRRGRRQ